MSTPRTSGQQTGSGAAGVAGEVMHLSVLLAQPLLSRSGETVGRLDDVIVRLRGGERPLVTGLVANVGGRRVYVPVKRVADLAEDRIVLAREKVDLRGFERRDGEVLLREDILGHRLIDVADAELVRAYDVELQATPDGWVLAALDTRRPARLFGLLKQSAGHSARDWKAFEPLIGHSSSAVARRSFGRVGKLKPAQIADLLEDADREEGHEILDQVHADPELEADVFEELDPDVATKLLSDMTDPEIAHVLARMRADDAADALAELRQQRRQPVLDLLPAGQRTKVLTLLGFNPGSAGGLMSTDVLTCPPDLPVGQALHAVAQARGLQPEALSSVHAVDPDGRLVGVASVIRLLQHDPAARLAELLDTDPVRIGADTDLADVALLMADYNLITIPVVDADNRIVGVVTVDDVLEAAIPDDWRRREPAARPPASDTQTADTDPPATQTPPAQTPAQTPAATPPGQSPAAGGSGGTAAGPPGGVAGSWSP